jgi:hypothetical protein
LRQGKKRGHCIHLQGNVQGETPALEMIIH